jgi:hypothetical protein
MRTTAAWKTKHVSRQDETGVLNASHASHANQKGTSRRERSCHSGSAKKAGIGSREYISGGWPCGQTTIGTRPLWVPLRAEWEETGRRDGGGLVQGELGGCLVVVEA